MKCGNISQNCVQSPSGDTPPTRARGEESTRYSTFTRCCSNRPLWLGAHGNGRNSQSVSSEGEEKERKTIKIIPAPSSGAIPSAAAQSSLRLGWRREGERRRGRDGLVVIWELPPISFPCPSQARQSRQPRETRARARTDGRTD